MAACGSSASHPELHLDITVSSDLVYVNAIEVERPDATSQTPFAHPGECDETSDAWSCDGDCPATWLGELRLEAAGAVIADGAYDWPWGGGIAVDAVGLDDAALVIEDLDGEEIVIPLPASAAPQPELTLTVDGEDAVIAWTATPAAATAVVSVGAGFGGPRCHTDDDTITLAAPDAEAWEASVHAFLAPTLVETAWGDAEVWIGDVTSVPNPAP